MIDRVVSHYRIVCELGRGGMGTVYEAEDLLLQRQVALKFISSEQEITAQARERFLREARAASSLSHPNICSVFDLSEDESGHPFLVMELLQGMTLKALLEGRKVGLEEGMALALQVASALAAAHSRGVIHRDLKPSNIFITREGCAKIMDFGLARRILSADAEQAWMKQTSKTMTETRPQLESMIGTPTYMSPEQVQGEALSPSSDIFACGIVFWEMFTGRHPFLRGTAMNTAIAIVRDPLHLVLDSGLRMPLALQSVLEKSLAKEREARYADGSELLAALQRAQNQGSVEATPQSKAALAVLPFRNLSLDTGDSYFAEGLAEDLINALGKLDGMKVVGRDSAFRFGDKDRDLAQLRMQLGVGLILSGSVRRAGQRLRVVAELVNTEDGFRLWSERYDRALEDIFAVQDDIVGAIVSELRKHFSLPAQAPHPASLRNLEAHNFYLKGRFFWNKRTPRDLQQAARLFSESVRCDASLAAGWTGLAECHILEGVYGTKAPTECFPQAQEEAERAVQLDPSLAEAYAILASVEGLFHWDWAAAEKKFRRALELNSSASTSHQWFANHCLIPQARFPEAWEQVRRARENDPLSLAVFVSTALLYLVEEDYEKAAKECRTALELDAQFSMAHYFLGQALGLAGNVSEAIPVLERAVLLSGRSSESLAVLSRTLASAGEKESALHILEELKGRALREYVSPVLLGQIYIGLQDTEAALSEFQRAASVRAADLVWIRVHPAFATLRGEARFGEILRTVHLA
jgi:eukaryotic-like serine/threonine-protein kinase